MANRSTQIWRRLSVTADYKWSQQAKQRFIDRWGEKGLLDADAHIDNYLEAYPSERGASNALWTLASMLERGDWPPPPPRPVPEARIETSFVPIGFAGDPILAEMPPLIQSLVEHRLQGVEVCADYAIAGALAMVAACCGNRLRVRAWGDTQLSNLYFLLVGETGTSFKSAIPKRIIETLSDVNPLLLAPQHTSWEMLVKNLSEQPSRIFVRDEFAGLLASIKGQDYLRPLREVLLELFSWYGPYEKGTLRATHRANCPALSVLATMQPKVFGEELLSSRNIESGFVNRFLIVVGGGVPRWPRVEGAEELRHRLILALKGLARSGVVTIEATQLEGAANIWRGQEIAAFGEYGDVVGRRASIQAIKLAAALEAANGWPNEGALISDRWLDVALRLLERWYREAAALVRREYVRTEGGRVRREMLEYIVAHSKNGGSSEAELLRHFQQHAKTLAGHLETMKAAETISQADDLRWFGV